LDDEVGRQKVLSLVLGGNGLKQTAQLAQEHVEMAKRALAGMRNSQARESLELVAQEVAQRGWSSLKV
jgi:geranylgeranyl pyrophosphate synthase